MKARAEDRIKEADKRALETGLRRPGAVANPAPANAPRTVTIDVEAKLADPGTFTISAEGSDWQGRRRSST